MGCPATLMTNGRVHQCDWPDANHRGHAHHNHDVGATWTDFYEDDEDPQDIRAAFDAGPHGNTGHVDPHTQRAKLSEHEKLTRDLSAAQDEIERLISEIQALRAAGDSPGVGMIAEERSRQVNVEGYSREHDAEHGHMQLAQAASAYALGGAAFWWPWDMGSFKPTRDPVRDLTKAGALIAAAIDAELAARNSGGAE